MGVTLLLSSSLVMIGTLWYAYLNGNMVTISINQYGEADFEALILAPITLILGFYVFYVELKEIKIKQQKEVVYCGQERG